MCEYSKEINTYDVNMLKSSYAYNGKSLTFSSILFEDWNVISAGQTLNMNLKLKKKQGYM